MLNKGTVVETHKGTAKVKVIRSSACSSCHNCEAKGACHVELVLGNQTEDVFVDAVNLANAKQGDMVQIEFSSKKTLFVSMLVFVLPIIISMISFVVTERYFNNINPSLMLILTFLCSFVLLVLFSNRFVKKNLVTYVVKVLEESET